MPKDSLLSIANLLLPKVFITYFDLTMLEVKGEELHFYFTELNKVRIKSITWGILVIQF